MNPPSPGQIADAIEALAAAHAQRDIARGRMLAAIAQFEHLHLQVTTQRGALREMIETRITTLASARSATIIPIGERRSQEPSDAA